MERDFISYGGVEYMLLVVSVSEIYPSMSGYDLRFADRSLWDKISDGYDVGDSECIKIDDSIYMYLDKGEIDSIGSIDELLSVICD